MPKRNKIQHVIDHIDNLEMAINEKVEDLNNAGDMMNALRFKLYECQTKGKPWDEKQVKAEAKAIWNCVMETPYDENY